MAQAREALECYREPFRGLALASPPDDAPPSVLSKPAASLSVFKPQLGAIYAEARGNVNGKVGGW
jgi:hypothetical protein